MRLTTEQVRERLIKKGRVSRDGIETTLKNPSQYPYVYESIGIKYRNGVFFVALEAGEGEG